MRISERQTWNKDVTVNTHLKLKYISFSFSGFKTPEKEENLLTSISKQALV